MTTISRQHARIEYKGNRFRIIDVSTNGTYINGKRIADVYLRDGDVITFAENGPKASFLTKIGSGSTTKPVMPSSLRIPAQTDNFSPPTPEPNSTVGADLKIQVLSTNAPLVIQFGQTIQKYNLLPITIGKNPSCDFVIADDTLSDSHVQIFFNEKSYYAKDLTGKGVVTVNGRPIETQSVLAQGAELSLSDKGPKFRFLGDGRLAEIQNVNSDSLATPATVSQPQQSKTQPNSPLHKKSLLQKIFRKGK